MVDGDIPYTVIINPAVSRDPLYDGLKASDISAVNIDDDRADIIVNPTEGLVTSKLGGSDTFTVVLGSKPMAVVTVDLSSSDTTAGIVSPDRLEFLPAYWNKPQTVKVTGQDDGTDGDVPYTVITAPAISDDTVYDGLDPDDVSVLNIDNLPPEPPQYVFPGPYHQFAPGQNINLQGSPFKDSDGDTHIGSLWWIWPASRDTGGCDNTPGFFEFFSDNALTSYNLPSNLLVPGVLYRWAVAYQDSGSGVFSWSDMSNNAQNLFIVGKEETYVAPPFPPGDSAADFRMLSCHHYILGNPLATAVIGDDLDGGVYDTRYYRIGTYDPLLGGGGYLEYPNFMLAPGTGVWILARNGLTVDITGIPVTTEEDVELELTFNESNNNGWNMIGPPNDRDYTWANVVLVSYGINDSCAPSFGPVRIGSLDPDNPYIDIRLWEWNGDDYVLATMLETDKGYWVKVKRKDIFLRFPVDAQVAWNNPDMMLAAGADKIKKTAVELVSPRKALAEDTGEGPPRPMAVIEDGGDTGTFASSGSGNCFIDTMNYR